ncbi:hypothetical protein ASC75_05480 [Aminobacter sp. DSM 101952]|uniref:restriction endonuclease subunit S n=1 Tax=Aminobacter sp. DSM 101952 TaxID=2735891 RepID=UPI0006F29054|nr:restriction endonuclease subunit S [Aminobacter sp. DSM 101952]KQU73110.1 hypothetical protein ASC75_05480 [Aminobacter sp. DSM 101952]
MSELPEGWEIATGDDLFASVRGVTYNKADASSTPAVGLIPILRANNIADGQIIADDLVYVPESYVAPEQYLQAGDLLLATSSGSRTVVGKAAAASEVHTPFAFGAFCTVARPRTEGFGQWLSSFARTRAYRDYVEQVALGISINNLRGSDLKAMPMAIAPLPEQRRIVTKIDSLTGKSRRARDHLNHVPRLVEKYKLAVLAAVFKGDLTREWRRDQQYFPPVSAREAGEVRSKFADAGEFVPPYELPASWRWQRLPQLGDLDRGKSRHRPRNDKRLFGGSYPFIQTGEIRQADRFLTSHSETYSEFGLAQSRLWPVGTVCITIAANIAETAILGIDACFPDSVVGFLPDSDRIDASYVEFFMRTARSELQAFAPATAQKNINLDTLATIRVPTAPKAEQTEIVRRVENAFTWIDRLASEATSARRLIDRLDQSVLAKAFRGELVPQDPTDEPASVLLERIRAEREAAPKVKRGRKAYAAA